MFIKIVSILLLSVFLLTTPYSAVSQSANLVDLVDIIDNENPGTSGVDHSVAFTLPDNALSITPTDYIQITLSDDFTSVAAATTLTGTYSGTPVFTISGNTARVTGIVLLPKRRLTIDGISADNPVSGGDFSVSVSVTEDEDGLIIKNYGTTTAESSTGTVTMSAELTIPQAIIQISGFTAPRTFVSFTEGANVIGTDLAGGTGYFSKYFPAFEPGLHEISLYAVDNFSRATSIVPLSINAPAYQTTAVSNILLSPTIEISTSSAYQGSDIYATGSAYPNTLITLFTETPLRSYTATTSATGVWTTTINDTSDYNPGDYEVYVIGQTSGGLQSLASQTNLFSIIPASGGSTGSSCGDISDADLNCDGSVDLTDFSVLMYYWATTNAAADINSDGIVDLTDFSILMFYWGA